MKKSDLFKIGVLLMATTLGTTGCSFGEDREETGNCEWILPKNNRILHCQVSDGRNDRACSV